jgi:hypothetical protein
VKATTYLLCDRATVREGLLHILGGGITRLGRPVLPAPLDVDLALMLTPDNLLELPGEHRVEVTVNGDDGTLVVTSVITFSIAEADETDPLPYLALPINLRAVGISAYGHYTVNVLYDNNQIARLRFLVEKQLSSGTTQQVISS